MGLTRLGPNWVRVDLPPGLQQKQGKADARAGHDPDRDVNILCTGFREGARRKPVRAGEAA